MTSGATLHLSEVDLNAVAPPRGRGPQPSSRIGRRSVSASPTVVTTIDGISVDGSATCVYHPDSGSFTDSIDLVDPETPVACTVVTPPSRGHLTLFTDGTYSYLPDEEFRTSGGSDTFTIRLCDYASLRNGSLAGQFNTIFGGDGDHTSTATVTFRIPGPR